MVSHTVRVFCFISTLGTVGPRFAGIFLRMSCVLRGVLVHVAYCTAGWLAALRTMSNLSARPVVQLRKDAGDLEQCNHARPIRVSPVREPLVPSRKVKRRSVVA